MSNESTGRRNFLKQVGGVAAAAAAVPVLLESAKAASSEVVSGPQPLPTGPDVRIALELDGSFAGWLDSAAGGAAVGEVVTEKMGADWLQKKHIGNVKYEEVSFKCGTGMSPALYDWMQASIVPGQKPFLKNGAVVAVDSLGQEQYRLSFANAFLTEITMPPLDAASKDAAKMTLKFKPETTRKQLAQGGKVAGAGGVSDTGRKLWPSATFRLTIDGLDEACSRVNKIEAITIKQKVTENAVGEMRDYEMEATSVEVPNLVVTLPAPDASQFLRWEEDFLIKGNNGDDAEKGGMLQYLNAEAQPLFTVQFKNLGLFKVAPDKMESGAEGIRRVKAEMYCEDIRFNYSPAASFG